MSQIRYEHPFKAPKGWLSTPQNLRSHHTSFSRNIGINEAVKFLEDEIRALDSGLAVVYSYYEHLNTERLRKKISIDSSISLAIKRHGQTMMFACDKYYFIEHNIYSMHLALRQIRGLEELGITSLDRILSVFDADYLHIENAANNNPTLNLPEWMQTLGLGPSATLEDAHAVYRRRAKHHANDETELLRLNTAMELARKAL